MKRILSILLILCLISGAAFAMGLSGLGDLSGNLPSLPGPGGKQSKLPSPAELLGYDGELYQEDYEYTRNHFFTVCLYDIPRNPAVFLEDYIAQAQQNGFEVGSELVDNYISYSFYQEEKNLTAYLLPEYSGKMMLLVENGMEFDLPMPDGYFFKVNYNGRDLMCEFENNDSSCKVLDGLWYNGSSYISFEGFFIEAEFYREQTEYMSLGFPDYIKEGEYYYVSEKGEEGITGAYHLSTDRFGEDYPDNHLENAQDYYSLKITKMDTLENGNLLIEGRFEATLYHGTEVYKNGSFRVLAPY